jgi:hypothetical protein
MCSVINRHAFHRESRALGELNLDQLGRSIDIESDYHVYVYRQSGLAAQRSCQAVDERILNTVAVEEIDHVSQRGAKRFVHDVFDLVLRMLRPFLNEWTTWFASAMFPVQTHSAVHRRPLRRY